VIPGQSLRRREVRGMREEPAMPAPDSAGPTISVSVIVPITERPAELCALYREYSAVLAASDRAFEFVFVVEPWNRELTAGLTALRREGQPIEVIEAGQTVGEASLMRLGAEHARGDILVTLPAYYRIEASALPGLIREVEAGADLVVARRWPRRDSWVNRMQTAAFHALLRGVGRGRFDDVACGVRAMRREVVDTVPLYGDFYRFFPLLVQQEGFQVRQVDAPQHPLDQRTRVYGPGVYVRRLIDLLGVYFLLRFSHKPLRFFGLVGSVLSGVGGGILLVVLAQRLGGQGIADRPLLLLGVLLFTLGFQAIALGLVGEIIVHLSASSARMYRLRDEEDGPS